MFRRQAHELRTNVGSIGPVEGYIPVLKLSRSQTRPGKRASYRFELELMTQREIIDRVDGDYDAALDDNFTLRSAGARFIDRMRGTRVGRTEHAKHKKEALAEFLGGLGLTAAGSDILRRPQGEVKVHEDLPSISAAAIVSGGLHLIRNNRVTLVPTPSVGAAPYRSGGRQRVSA